MPGITSATQSSSRVFVPQNNSAASASNDEKKQTSGDTLTLSSASGSAGAYSKTTKHNVDTDIINRLKQESEISNKKLREYVANLIVNQGNVAILKPDSASILQANQAVSEDGDFGVKAVSDRIVEFAKAISGGDRTKLDTLKSAIEKGFEEATKTFNGNMPDITKRTHDEIMKKLDAWANET